MMLGDESSAAEKKTYISLAQINASLPRLSRKVTCILGINHLLKQALWQMKVAGLNLDIAPDVLLKEAEDTELIDLMSDVCVLSMAAQSEIDQLTQCGAVIDDLQQGCLLWPGQIEGRVIQWCWQLGETEVRYWRQEEESFAQRRRIRCVDTVMS